MSLVLNTAVVLGESLSPVISSNATGSKPTNAERRILTGWGGGKAEDVVPKAAEIGFSKLVVHHQDAANFTKFIELGERHGIDIYAWLFLGDIPAWKKAFPDADSPLQVMRASDNRASVYSGWRMFTCACVFSE
jgi:hypothetical protein